MLLFPESAGCNMSQAISNTSQAISNTSQAISNTSQASLSCSCSLSLQGATPVRRSDSRCNLLCMLPTLHALVPRVCRVQHQPGIQKQDAACWACWWSTCWQEPSIMNKVHPVRHAAGLVVDETLAGHETQWDRASFIARLSVSGSTS